MGFLNLTDAPRSHGTVRKMAKTGFDRLPKLLAQHRLDALPGCSGNIRLQCAQSFGVGLTEQVSTGAQELSKLHVNRPQLREDAAKHLRQRKSGSIRRSLIQQLTQKGPFMPGDNRNDFCRPR